MPKVVARGSAVVELALLTPLVVLMVMGFVHFGFLTAYQIDLEKTAILLARELAISQGNLPPEDEAVAWLAAHHEFNVQPKVAMRTLASLPRPYPRNNAPVEVLILLLKKKAPGFPLLIAQSREVVL